MIDVHVCDCVHAEADCAASGGIWTDGCRSCLPDGGKPSAGVVDGGPIAGCYVPQDSSCDCQLAEAQCAAVAGIWTEGCESCRGDSDIDSGTSRVDAAADQGESNLGCYMPESFACDCSLSETACTQSDGIWTAGCDSCAALQPIHEVQR